MKLESQVPQDSKEPQEPLDQLVPQEKQEEQVLRETRDGLVCQEVKVFQDLRDQVERKDLVDHLDPQANLDQMDKEETPEEMESPAYPAHQDLLDKEDHREMMGYLDLLDLLDHLDPQDSQVMAQYTPVCNGSHKQTKATIMATKEMNQARSLSLMMICPEYRKLCTVPRYPMARNTIQDSHAKISICKTQTLKMVGITLIPMVAVSLMLLKYTVEC